MNDKRERDLGQGLLGALLFPFYPGVLIYNVVALLLLGLAFMTAGDWVQSVSSNFEMVQEHNSEIIQELPADEMAEIEQMLNAFRQMGASESDIEEIKSQMLSQSSISDGEEAAPINFDTMPSPSSLIFPIMIALLTFIFITTKNFDVTAQIAEADFDAPSYKINSYVSPFIALKFFLGALILYLIIYGISFALMFLVMFLPFFIIFFFLLWLAIMAMYPAMVLATIRTNSLWGVVNPKEWLETISEHVGWLNYILLLVFLLVMAVVLAIAQFLLPLATTGNASAIGIVVAMILLFYINLHLNSSNHYLMGFMTQHETHTELKGDFGGYEKKGGSRQRQHSVIDDAKQCLQENHVDDAIKLLDMIIKNPEDSEQAITAYELLMQAHSQLPNSSQLKAIQRQFLTYVMQHAPQQQARAIPAASALAKSGEWVPDADQIKSLADYMLRRRDYKGVLKIVGAFAKKHPGHVDTAANYYLVSKALIGLKQYNKAYKILGGLMKQFPNSPLALDIKSEFLAVKRKIGQSS